MPSTITYTPESIQAMYAELQRRFFIFGDIDEKIYYAAMDMLRKEEMRLNRSEVHKCLECGKQCDCGELDERLCLACSVCAGVGD